MKANNHFISNLLCLLTAVNAAEKIPVWENFEFGREAHVRDDFSDVEV